MKAFRIGTSGWEIYGEHILTHGNKTEEEFKDDCKSSLRETLSEVTKTLEDNNSDIFLNAYELMVKTIPKLEKLGYSFLVFDGDYEVPGSDISYKSSDSESVTNELGQELVEFMRKAKEIELEKYK